MIPEYGDWRIVREIGKGKGRFGSVYEIEKNNYGIFKAALKVITIPQEESQIDELRDAGLDDQGIRQYFEGEIKESVKEFVLMSKLKGNSNIVSYEDHQIKPHTDKIGWDIYIRMELLTPLDEYFRSHGVTRQDVIQLGIDICKALEQCQKMKIIHRDIKPANILVSQLGDYKLGDFGIARTTERTISNMTRGRGTDNYMAPEVYKGEKYGSSVDIYSLGMVMYKLLNKNRRPFLPQYPANISCEDEMKAKVQRMSGVPIPPPCEDNTRLAEIVLKACSYNPAERYSSPFLMRHELESILYTDEDKSLFGLKDEQLDNPTSISILVEDEDKSELTSKVFADRGSFEKEDNFRDNEEVKKNEVKVITETEVKEDDEEETVTETENEEEIEGEVEEENFKQETLNEIVGTTGKFKFTPKIAAIIALVVLLCSGGVAGAIYYNSMTVVPDVKGMTLKEAKEAFAAKDLLWQLVKENSDEIEKDFVIGSENTGKRVKKESTVIIWVSKGSSIVVPDVSGKDYKEAVSELKNLGLSIELDYKYSDTYKENLVIEQSIEVGSKLNEGDSILITYSLGPEPFALSDYSGMTLKAAKKMAEDIGLIIETSKKYSDSVKSGYIISQSPKAGEEVKKGDTITFKVSKGIEQIKVPNVVGMSQSKATASLEKVGFEVVITEEYSNSVSLGNVISQGTDSGKKVDKGSLITISISKGEKPSSETTSSSSSGSKKSSSSSTSSSSSSSKKSSSSSKSSSSKNSESKADATWDGDSADAVW